MSKDYTPIGDFAQRFLDANKDRIDREVFDLFKTLHPNSTEEFNPTPGNVQRWRWHNGTAQLQRASDLIHAKKYEHKIPDSFAELIEKRRVQSFDDFDARTKGIYRHIASLFPGVDVFACGSRVRGDYVNAGDDPKICEWRAAIGKAEKVESDFDFYAPLDAIPVSDIPPYADRLRHGIPAEEKILIPMERWDFSKLPESEHARVIDLFNRERWRELANIHDQYRLSNYSYCCDLSGIKTWFRYGIERGEIKSDGANEPNAGF